MIFSWLARASISMVLATALACAASVARGEELPRALPATITTGFDVKRDGLPFSNNGDLTSPDGNCWGMSLLAIDNFLRRQANPRAAAPAPQRTTRLPNEADPRLQAAASLAQDTAIGQDKGKSADRRPLFQPAPVRAALERMSVGGAPEVLIIEGPVTAHAVVVHGYRDGALRLYDPNYPGEELAWPWDPVRGFGKHPKATPGNFYDTLSGATSVPFDAHTAGKTMAALREACAKQAAECTGRFPSLRAELERRDDGAVELVGQTAQSAAGGATPTQVWVAVNGVPIGVVEVSRFGTFRAVLPRVALRHGLNQLRVVGQVRSPGGTPQFAGFAEVEVLRPRARPREANPEGYPTRTKGLVGALEEEP